MNLSELYQSKSNLSKMNLTELNPSESDLSKTNLSAFNPFVQNLFKLNSSGFNTSKLPESKLSISNPKAFNLDITKWNIFKLSISSLNVLVFLALISMMVLSSIPALAQAQSKKTVKPNSTLHRYLYVAVPGIRNYLGYGGHGLLVFDILNNHRFVKRIATQGLDKNGIPANVKGVAVSLSLNSIFISTLDKLQRIDLNTEKIVWEKTFEGGADRMSISPDGKTMYLPSLEKTFWNVVDCETGQIIAPKIQVVGRAHNTLYGPSGTQVYLADIASPLLHVADNKTHTVVKKVGPFGNGIRPFTINSAESLVFVTVDSLLGFEVGDLKTGKKLARIVVEGWNTGPVRRHGNPSHGIGLTPDEKELWVCDGFNMRLHVFNAFPPYQQLTTIPLQDMPGWVTFSLDGRYAYPSSGEVIDVKTRKIITTLQDEFNNNVASEKMLEIQIQGGKAIQIADQFGIGRAGKIKSTPTTGN
jgi:DNA-binding beta-propeller fold protein YncE